MRTDDIFIRFLASLAVPFAVTIGLPLMIQWITKKSTGKKAIFGCREILALMHSLVLVYFALSLHISGIWGFGTRNYLLGAPVPFISTVSCFLLSLFFLARNKPNEDYYVGGLCLASIVCTFWLMLTFGDNVTGTNEMILPMYLLVVNFPAFAYVYDERRFDSRTGFIKRLQSVGSAQMIVTEFAQQIGVDPPVASGPFHNIDMHWEKNGMTYSLQTPLAFSTGRRGMGFCTTLTVKTALPDLPVALIKPAAYSIYASTLTGDETRLLKLPRVKIGTHVLYCAEADRPAAETIVLSLSPLLGELDGELVLLKDRLMYSKVCGIVSTRLKSGELKTALTALERIAASQK